MLDVLIVGGGPVGLFLGCLLARRGLRFQVLERRPAPSSHSRAIGIHPPALEAFRDIGLTQGVLSAGLKIRSGIVRGESDVLGELSFVPASTAFPFVLALPQRRTEELLEQRLHTLAPGALRRQNEVMGVQAQDSCVSVMVRGPDASVQTLQARFVIGADGCRSDVRRWAGVAYPGGSYADTYLMGDFPDTTPFGTAALIYLRRGGVVESFPLPGGLRRWVAWTPELRRDADASALARLLGERTGLYVPAGECSMLSAFEVRRHAAARMVAGRALLIGDAAHEVSPIGGQGMNLGWLDAAALAPALELALTGPASGNAALKRVERVRQRSARLATRQAELNMLAGRPLSPAAQRRREGLIKLLLSRPVQPLLAQAFAMRWL